MTCFQAIHSFSDTQKDTNAAADLEEMQALHYLVEQGDCHRRAGKLNLALKKYYAIQKVSSSFVPSSKLET
jgi:peptide alpha-N-acetyltransferase